MSRKNITQRGAVASLSSVAAAIPKSHALYEIVCDMEGDVDALRDFALGIALLSESMGDHATIVQRLAWEIQGRVDALEENRGKLLDGLHPNRGHFERVGRPGRREEAVQS